uniref:Carboxylic ester hydrolase n=1 Tax=Mythimna separata TaxID=271217 RepID=A0A5B9D4B6_MYTSE|nr:carboxylesterase 14 [Mythimna separata]
MSLPFSVRAKWLVLWSLWLARFVRQPTDTLQLSNGPVRGTISPDGTHKSFQAIPYASVPHRFQAPGPEPKWTSTFEAVDENVRCMQSVADAWTVGSMDCLTLNVYTPLDADPHSKLPVMFYIHGGGYFKGSGNKVFYGPNFLVSKQVILVAINYRLNIQGFLCLGIKENPGNAGMKDQVAALRWVQRNIRKFGGDPDNVTIFGESAGAASASLHIYSPMSKGLFHKVITQSGSALAPWAYQYKPIFMASLLARTMLYESQDPHELYNYFMSKSNEELILTRVPRKEGNTIISEILYTPCREKPIEGVEAFLLDSPFDLLHRGDYHKVPMIIGTNNEEGLLILGMDNDTMIPRLQFERSLPKNLHIPDFETRRKVAKELEELYMEGEKISVDSIVRISRWYGEPNLSFPSLSEVEGLVETSDQPVYSYLFKYCGRRNIPKFFLPRKLKAVPGATHADDIFYIFSQKIIFPTFEKEMIERVTTMWTNFAKYGDPTPEGSNLPLKWERANRTAPTSLVIDEPFHAVPLFYNDRLKHLKEVYSKFRRKEYD